MLALPRGLVVGDHHESVGFGKRQRAEEHGVHDAEHRRVRADPKRQREQGNDAERRTPRQRSHGVTRVLEQRIASEQAAR